MDVHSIEVLEFDRVRLLLAAQAAGPLGRAVAVALEPGRDEQAIRLALRQVEEARALLETNEAPRLDDLADPIQILDQAHDRSRPLEPAEARAIQVALDRARALRDHFARRRERAPELDRLAERFRDLSALSAAIDAVVAPPADVKDSASPRLWELRKERAGLEDEIRARLQAQVESSAMRSVLQSPSFTIRNGRWVLPVKLDMKGKVRGILHDSSQTGATVFIEPAGIVPLSNRMRELDGQIRTELGRILWELTRTLGAARNEILHAANLLAWFDFSFAKARLAAAMDMTSPEASPDGRLRLVAARHPLLMDLERERGGEAVVPLDLRLREGFRILVITGPNTGGKTVTLKTLGLLQLMYQAGMQVPAGAGTRLPVFRDVFADIGDEQSLSQSLSTFSGHVRNVVRILEGASNRSLVLLDELGAGTDPAEGAALGRAILEELRGRRSAVVVTTHLGSLKNYAFSHAEVENASVEFDVATLRPTYRLLIGQPGNSKALEIASRHGLADEILDAARRELETGGRRDETELIEKLQESRIALERTRAESERHLQRSRNLAKAAEERQRHLEKKAQRIGGEAENVIDDTLRRLLLDIDAELRELGNVPKALRPAYDRLRDKLRSASRGTSLAEKRRAYIATLRKQDEIYVPRLGQNCIVRKFNRAEETISVLMGKLVVEISYDEVGLPDARELR
ncbi:MAG: endonuclease MutS2 [Planctomycetes bacterium]|nr:endonuclease MutS2 [Planctomycetota bacterium]